MRYPSITITLILVITQYAYNQVVDDTFGIDENTPTCIPVTANDGSGAVINSVTNATNGLTFLNYPPFYFGNTSMIVMETTDYQILNYAAIDDPFYSPTSNTTWVNTTAISVSAGTMMSAQPNVGSSTGSIRYGNSLAFNIMFRNTGSYYVSVRGFAGGAAAHLLYQETTNSTINFISKGGAGFRNLQPTGSWVWVNSEYIIKVLVSAPVVSRVHLAVKDDGFRADQIVVSKNNITWTNNVTQTPSQLVNCAPGEVLYLPSPGFTGVDNFTYQGLNSTATVWVYVGVPLPSPSVTPTPSPSVTPSLTPSVTPTRTPSPSASPSANSSASVTPSSTPSTTPSPSVTPTSSANPTATASPTASTSVSATPSPTPNPPLCESVGSTGVSSHTIYPFNETSNFGQTFKPYASGMLLSVSLKRADANTGVLNGTAFLLLDVVTNPDSGITLQSFPFSMSGGGWQVFEFNPPLRLDTTRYLFLLDNLEGDSPASMMLGDVILANQYTVIDQEIGISTALFSYCMVPDFIPSPSISPSPSSTPSTSASTSLEPQHQSSSEDGGDSTKTRNTIVGATVGVVGVLLLVSGLAIVAFLLRRRKKKNDEENANMELQPRQPSEMHYAPISYNAFETVQPDSEWNIKYSDLKLITEIGRGAFGVVYKGTWQGQQVAVKQARNEVVSTTTTFHLQDFFAEAELMKKLKPHPNVTRLIGVCSHPGCIVLEFVDNGTLSDYLFRTKKIEKSTEISIAKGIAAGMLYLHNEGIIHRDLAARNILLDSHLCPKVSDFGMSRQVLEEKNTNKTMSEVGPIRWMAPEAMKEKIYNRKTDVWSYGTVLYELMTRNMPYHQYDLMQVATKVILKEISLVPEVKNEGQKHPKVLVELLEMCMQHEAESRPTFVDITNTFEKETSNENVQ